MVVADVERIQRLDQDGYDLRISVAQVVGAAVEVAVYQSVLAFDIPKVRALATPDRELETQRAK